MLSVVNVEVSQDLKCADIYMSFFSSKEIKEPSEYFKEFCNYKNSIKYKLGLSLKLKYMPKIKFKLADDYEYYDKINRLLKNEN